MNKFRSKLLNILLMGYLILVGYSAQTHAAVTLSQSPLFLTKGVDPNVMFVIDDSGSMRFEIMPEKYRQIIGHLQANGNTRNITTDAIFPRTNVGIFSATTEDDYHMVAPGAADNVFGMLVRSSVNTIYYNPAVQYKPWIKADGTSFANANTTCTYEHPLKTTGVWVTACRNLAPATDEPLTHPSTAPDGVWRPTTDYTAGTATIQVRTANSTNHTTTFVIGDSVAINGRIYKITNVTTTVVSGLNRRNLTLNSALQTDIGTGSYVITAPQMAKCTAHATCSLQKTGSFYPATYWYYNPDATDPWNTANYTLREIKLANAPFTGEGRTETTRPDCTTSGGVTSCTYTQELQNFANWYTYYRNRLLTAQAGIGFAFNGFNGGMRVGYAAINKNASTVDGIASLKVVKTGVRDFSGANKTDFYTNLYNQDVAGGTPLRSALTAVGGYFSVTTNAGPWGDNPGTSSSSSSSSVSNQAACRVSNTILMTDGYWNDSISSFTEPGNSDGTDSANYVAGAPFKDVHSDTLADVAMKYWKTDLHTTLDNKVPKAIFKTAGQPDLEVDPATWQHMNTYTVGLGVDGTLNVNTDVLDVLRNGLKDKTTGTVLDWPSPGSEGGENEQKIDDMFHAAVNGRGRFFSAKKPDEFANNLRTTLDDISKDRTQSAAAAAANSTSLNTGSFVFTAIFSSEDWTGYIQAKKINTSGILDTNSTWTSSIPPVGSRTILSYNTTTNSGIVFSWDNISAAQQGQFKTGGTGTDPTSDVAGQARLNWVRGVNPASNTSTEAVAYDLRKRNSIMGDIVNSDPAYAGNNDMGFSRLSAALGGSSYKNYFDTTKKNRREVIYVGANDGMLHGFNAKNPSSGTMSLGLEVFAYVPSEGFVNFKKLAKRDYGTSANKHQYFVDGPLIVSDAYVNGVWKNILVGTLGAGGKGIYVLDVTNPDAMNSGKVLFELTSAKYPQLGNITGRALVAPAADGRWKIFLGNGYNSGDDKAYLGIIDIDDEVNKASAGSSRTKFIAAGAAAANALAQPALLPGPQGFVTAAYAGDLLGNLWKFDLSSTSHTSWALAFSGTPLFVAKKGAATQPITASPTLGFNSKLSPARVMVYFGTGRYVTASDNAADTTGQSFYAIADKEAVVTNTGTRSGLHQKTIVETTTTQRSINGEVTGGNSAVNWATVNGWYLDFPTNERITTKPLLIFDRLIFPTIIPSDDICASGGSGWLMQLMAVGEKVTFSPLEPSNFKLDDPIYGQISLIEGSARGGDGNASAGGSSVPPSSATNECGAGANSGKSGTIAVLGNDVDGNAKSFVGGRPCDLYDRQSWRELE